MIYTTRDRADVTLFSEQCHNANEETGWFSDSQGKAAVFVSSDMAVDAAGSLDTGFR